MKNKKYKICKTRSNKKTIYVKSRIKYQKQLATINQQKTSTSIKYEPQFGNQTSIFSNMKEYQQQMEILKKQFQENFNHYNFKVHEKQFFEQFVSKTFNFPPMNLDTLLKVQQCTNLANSFQNKNLFNYLKILNYQLSNKQKKIILNSINHSFKLVQGCNRDQCPFTFQGRFISELQRQILSNRTNFIEKLKISQQKYYNYENEISQATQQLLFLGRIYKQNQYKLKNLTNNITSKIDNLYPIPQKKLKKVYYQVIMKKNIAYSFNQNQIDVYNYFKQKQYQQRKHQNEYGKLNSQKQFKQYLKYKRNKKGKLAKYGLATACSCCFSDYYELANPFVTCQGCNLRCHSFCLDLSQKSCSNCSYKRMGKMKKKQGDFCFICGQKGFMNYKLNQQKYGHYFCLLIHGLWQVSTASQSEKVNYRNQKYKLQCINQKNYKYDNKDFQKIQNQNCQQIIIENKQLIQSQHQCFRINEKDIRSLNSRSIITQCKYDSQSFNKSRQKSNPRRQVWFHLQFFQPYIEQNLNRQKNTNLSLNIDFHYLNPVLQSKKPKLDDREINLNYNLNPQLIDIQDHQNEILKVQNECNICKGSIFKDLFVKCSHCSHKYHAFCAFFEGFRFLVNQNVQQVMVEENYKKQSRMNIVLDCCMISSIQKENLKRKRAFVLNKNKFLFQNI